MQMSIQIMQWSIGYECDIVAVWSYTDQRAVGFEKTAFGKGKQGQNDKSKWLFRWFPHINIAQQQTRSCTKNNIRFSKGGRIKAERATTKLAYFTLLKQQQQLHSITTNAWCCITFPEVTTYFCIVCSIWRSLSAAPELLPIIKSPCECGETGIKELFRE